MKKIIATLLMIFSLDGAWAGAWGAKAFENDVALDWMSACVRSQGNKEISDALEAVLSSNFVDADVGAVGIAAAEVVAAQHGKPGLDLPEELRVWIERQGKSNSLKMTARKVVEKIKNSKTSELAAEWASNGQKEWRTSIDNLAKRLSN